MIFVTVGTHEQQFNRLVETIDKLKINGIIKDDVLIQTGYSTYKPKACESKQWIPYQDMIRNVEKADLIITHGGPSSFIMPLQVGKIPIVVPRKKEFDEHVNNHQVDFCKAVEERYGTIIVQDDEKKLEDTICHYFEIIKKKNSQMVSNNKMFNEKLEKIVEEMF